MFLGVDGGQSGTTALIGDDTGAVIGVGVGGPCNHAGAVEGPAKLQRTVRECLSLACAQAGLNMDTVRFRAACFGMSGGPADKKPLLSEMLETELLLVTDDAVIALAGALGGAPGVITIAGTGSIAFGRNAQDNSARAGGWGYVFGDEGGAFDIVRQALRASLRYEEGWGRPTRIREMLLSQTGAADVNAVLHLFYTTHWPRSRVARLAPHIDRLAEEGDAVASDLLTQAAQQLALSTASVSRQLWEPGDSVRVSYIGGVFQSRLLLDRYRCLVELERGCEVSPPLLGPAEGALLEAYRAAGISPPAGKLLSSKFLHGKTLDPGPRP